jgi:hypothetical protein
MNAPAQSLGVVLPEVIAFIRRFVVLGSSEELDTLALWVAHTHAFEAADATPYLAITSPQKGCRKTQLLEVLSLITPRSWKIDGVPTEAVLFRKIERDEPTIFLDEADRLFRSGAERVEPLVALLNAGNRRGAKVPRCVSQGNDLRDFSVFCPKALSGIDHARWPETIRDRAIVIQPHRRTAGEPVERFRLRLVERDAQPVYTRLATAVDAVADRLGDAQHPQALGAAPSPQTRGG